MYVYIIMAVVIFRATKFHGPCIYMYMYIYMYRVTPIATAKFHMHDVQLLKHITLILK